MLRTRDRIGEADCVTHALVSVASVVVDNHLDGSANLPFGALGLADNYTAPVAAVARRRCHGASPGTALPEGLAARLEQALSASSPPIPIPRIRPATRPPYSTARGALMAAPAEA